MIVKQSYCCWVLGSHYFLKVSPQINIAVGDSHIESVSAVTNLGTSFDEHMSMETFVHKKCAAIQGQLKKLTELKKFELLRPVNLSY